MAAALQCWPDRLNSAGEESGEVKVLMKTHERSEALRRPSSSSSSSPSSTARKWRRSFAGALAAIKRSLNISHNAAGNPFWGTVVRNLTLLYPGSQLPERLITNVRVHFDSLPTSYHQAGFDMKEVLLHVRLIEQANSGENPAIHLEEDQLEAATSDGTFFKLTFAASAASGGGSAISWPAISNTLDAFSISYKRVQVFEKKDLTLGAVKLLVRSGKEKHFKSTIAAALKTAAKKTKSTGVKLHFSLCGCEDEISRITGDVDPTEPLEEEDPSSHFPVHHPSNSLFLTSPELRRWFLSSDVVEFGEKTGPNTFAGLCRGRKARIKKLRGFQFEIRPDLLQIMTSGHKNILQFVGILADEINGICFLTNTMDGGSVAALIQRNKKMGFREAMKIALDVAEGLLFMNNNGVSYSDLNTKRILLDDKGNACLGDMGLVSPCKNSGEATDYETAGYRWLAPEIISGDPENVKETRMSNVYSFGMLMWEMVTGESAYAACSPVQAAVGISSCGLRPEMPGDCPPVLRSLMEKCWRHCPSQRPSLEKIISTLVKYMNL